MCTGKSRSLLHNGENYVDTDSDDNPYGLTVKPGPPFEVPPKTPAVHVPPNIQIDTVVDDKLIYHSKSEDNSTDTETNRGKQKQININVKTEKYEENMAANSDKRRTKTQDL